MRVLIDTNILLDFLLQREPFFQNADLLFQAIDSDRILGIVSQSSNSSLTLTSPKAIAILKRFPGSPLKDLS